MVVLSCCSEVREAQLHSSALEDEGLVVPLVMQNKPPTVEGREEDELADVELRPEQVGWNGDHQ